MNTRFIFFILLSFVYVTLSGQTVVRQVKPSDTDPQITTFNVDSHYVYINSNVTALNLLVVHLPGSFGEPKRATRFGSTASDLGFHSIGLMYPNVPTVGSFCTNSNDADCFEDVRREIVEGVDYSTSVAIDSNECILNRVRKLLVYLHQNFPNENWGQYLDNNNDLIYNKIIFSGHSQGGGHAAIIAKYYPIRRALCFSSPKDWRNVTNAPPLWLSAGTWNTPSGEIFCFNHVLDEHTNHQLEIWDSLGLNAFAPPVNVDSFSSPYNLTRQLTTSYGVPAGDEHACTIQDNKTPIVSGVPAFLPVWIYMLTFNITSVESSASEISYTLEVYPNPGDDCIYIDLNKNPKGIYIYNEIGSLVYYHDGVLGLNYIDISSFPTGLYFIRVAEEREIRSSKFYKL